MYNEMSVTLISVSHDTVVSNKHEEWTRHYYVIFQHSTPPPVSAIEAYVQTLKTQGKDKAEVLQTLKLCYEDPLENIASVELEDF